MAVLPELGTAMNPLGSCLRSIVRNGWGILLLLVGWQVWVVASELNAIVMPRPLGVLAAGTPARLCRLALPAAVPSWAVALRVACGHAVLAAMVAEYLMGTAGLGYLFAQTRSDFNMERAFGATVLATLVSVTFFLA